MTVGDLIEILKNIDTSTDIIMSAGADTRNVTVVQFITILSNEKSKPYVKLIG